MFLDLEKLPNINNDKIPTWTVLTFLILTIGYVGYFSFCALNKITYSIPNLYLIVGIGLMNLIYWIFIYSAIYKSDDFIAFKSVMIASFLQYFTYNPITWALFSIFFFIIYSRGYLNAGKIIDKAKSTDNEVTDNAGFIPFYDKWSNKTKFGVDCLFLLIISIFSFLYGMINFALYFVTYFLLLELSFSVKNKIIWPYQLIVLLIIVPSFLSYSLLNTTNFSIYGISKSVVQIIDKSNIATEYCLIFQDEQFLYLKNEIKNDTTIIQPKSNISSMKVIRDIEYPNNKGILNREEDKPKQNVIKSNDKMEKITLDSIECKEK